VEWLGPIAEKTRGMDASRCLGALVDWPARRLRKPLMGTGRRGTMPKGDSLGGTPWSGPGEGFGVLSVSGWHPFRSREGSAHGETFLNESKT
jgi:hypothetical protein